MSTTYGYTKQVESNHQGSKHTLAILMSKLRSSLGAAWEQPRSSLEYAYSMLMTTFLRPFSSKRAELERCLVPDEITARPSRDYGSSLTRLRLVVSMLLLLIVGSGNVWGQTEITALSQITDANGNYIIKNDISGGAPGVSTFNGTLEAAINPETHMPYLITGLSAPLFTTLTGTVKNLVLESVGISGHDGNTGAIACTANGAARIYNVGILSGSVGGTGYTGGLVGLLDGTARVINCYSYANITGGSNVAGIVGNNNQTSSQTNLKTIVVNCMFYGNITGGTSVYPVYGGKSINNDSNTGINPYCYFRKNATLTPTAYNRSWPAEEKNLTRFEYYRSVLNSNRKLCTWWVNGTSETAPTDEDVANVGIAKWVLDPSIAPYPILKKWGKYPSVINLDPDKVWDPRTEIKEGDAVTSVTPHWVQRSDAKEWEGKSYGTLAVTIKAGAHGSGSTSRNIPITDMDTLNCDYSYYKIQLPYYNEVFGNPNGATHAEKYGGNYTEYVVTGWEIEAAGSTTATDYNFADRNSITGRVFAQGGYYYVPKEVSSITITARWGKAFYLSNRGYSIDRVNVTNAGYKSDNAFAPAGTVSNTFQGQPVYDDLQNAIKALGTNTDSPTVYDQAIVLIGNHQVKNGNNGVGYSLDSKWHPFTIMSADFDFDNEPDYCLQFQFRDGTPRPGIQPIRFDFLPVVELGLALRHNSWAYAIGIFVPQGHFEVTETAFMRTTQFEYDGFNSYTDRRIEDKSPVIINGGEYEMFVVRYHDSNRTSYFLLGGNAWIHRFAPGAHPNTGQKPSIYLCPVNVIGGEVKELYLTGLYRPELAVPNNQGAPRCYTDGGKFDIMAGAGYDKVEAGSNVTFKINHSKITEFYGGGINATNPISGNINVTIDNSYVDKYCGGPKVGDMTGKTVTTHATGTTFGVFYGGGNGGNSYYRHLQKDGDMASSHIGTWTDQGYNWNNFNPLGVKDDGTDNKGYHAEYEFEVFNHSNGVTDHITQRGFIKWIQFGITKTGDVSSTLSDCKILGNFYGGGNLATVDGNVTSTLTNTQVDGSVFGAGYSAAIPTFQVHDKSTVSFPSITAGVITDGYIGYDSKVYEWTNEKLEGKDEAYMKAHPTYEKDGKWYCYTWNSLDDLGAVTGNVTLTIDGNTTLTDGKVMKVAHSVYGGGEESGVAGNTEVTVTGGTIGTTGKGGAEYGNVYGGGKGKADDVTAGIVKGSTNVSISGSPTILHNVYGGGAYGSVGTFSYDGSGFPTGWTDDKGKCSVSITGGTIGTTGDNNGMVFGSSRGLEGDPSNPNVDKMAWVYDTDVTIGTQSAQSNATPWIKGSVYGGGENGHNFHDAKVTVHSGTIGILEGAEIIDDRGTPGDTSDDISYTGARFPNRGNVYGSGCGTDTYTGTDSKTYFDFNAGIVRGNTTVLIDGGHVVHNVYGGGAMGSVGTYTFDANGKPTSCADGTGTCTVTVSGGQIGVTGAKMAGYGKGGPDDFGHVFGAGRGEMHDPDQYPNVETCAFFNKTILNISGTAFLTGSAYGGSESGHVLGDTEVNISGGQIGCGKNATKPYGSDVWADSYTPTGSVTESLDCASWPFESPFAPYDPFANATGDLDKYPNGHSTDGGRLEASDGHTYYGNVFGGGSGSVPYFDETEDISKYLSTAGSVEGKTTINISGGHIITNVYGGCESTNVKGSATITMTGGTVGVPRTVAQIIAHPNTGYIFGAGKGDQRIFFNKETNVDRTFVNIEGGRVYGSIFGGGEDGHVFQNAIVNIGKTGEDGPTIGTSGTSYVDGNVFGGGRGFGGEALTAGNIGGSIELNIKSGKILGSVYGGGRLGSVGYGLYLTSEEGYGILRPDDEYDGSYPNPSTEEASTYYNKGRGYIVINISGGTIGNDAEYIYNPTAEQKAAIPNTTFDYQNHLQYTKGGNVFTGGMGRLYALDNTTLLPLWPKLGKCKQTTLNMTGGTVKSSIYGGGEIGAVAKNATVNVNGGTVGTKVVDPDDNTKYYYFGSVFGGGKGSVDNITYPSTTPEADKIPISEAGTTGGNVAVNLNEGVAENKKGAIVSQVFGCNDMNGSPKGTVTVHVYSTQTAENADIATKPEKGTDTYDVMAVYGGGNLAAYEPTDLSTGKTNVIIDGCGLTSVRQVYGGGNAASTPATDVEINGSYEILELFGGGNGADKLPTGADNPGANVGYKDYHLVENDPAYATKEARTEGAAFAPYRYGTGEATVNIKGGTIHRVFGGSNTKGNVRKTALTLLEELQSGGVPVCPFHVDEAYGGGKSAPMDAEAQLHMACIPGLQEAYGGAEAADIHDNVTLTITNGTFNRVFGGNNISGTISGKITVNVEETGCRPVVIGELYGGGNLAAYSIYGYNDDGTPKESGDNPFDDPEVNVRSFTSIGAVYGGGYGTGAKMIASPTVNINESLGTPDTYPTTGDYDENGFKGKTITLDAGKETEHTVTLPAHTKGKMGAIGDVFGGGNAAEVKGNTTVNIGTLSENTFVSLDDNPATTETDESKKPVLGADIRGNVYGGGNNAEVTGNTNVTIGKKNE